MAAKGKAQIRYAVLCNKHGMKIKKDLWSAVFVAKPKNRSAGLAGGCPRCAAEAARAG